MTPNITRTRQKVVTAICEAMGAHVAPNHPAFFFAECEGEPLVGRTSKSAKVASIAGDVDGLVITAENGEGDKTAFVHIEWGQGTGMCVNDLSECLFGSPNWKPISDMIEYLDI